MYVCKFQFQGSYSLLLLNVSLRFSPSLSLGSHFQQPSSHFTITFEELSPLLIQEEAREKLFNKSDEKALYSKDKSGKGKPKDPKKAEKSGRRR